MHGFKFYKWVAPCIYMYMHFDRHAWLYIDPVHGIICTRLLLFITVLKIFLSRIG